MSARTDSRNAARAALEAQLVRLSALAADLAARRGGPATVYERRQAARGRRPGKLLGYAVRYTEAARIDLGDQVLLVVVTHGGRGAAGLPDDGSRIDLAALAAGE